MAENLRLGSNDMQDRTLNSDTSDISGSWTMPESKIMHSSLSDNTAYIYIDDEFGGYYSWLAATAGTGTYSKTSGNASDSICPKGWKLPTGCSGGDFQTMAKKYGSGTDTVTGNALLAQPIPGYKLMGVYYGNGEIRRPGQNDTGWSVWWSSTASGSASYACNLCIYTSKSVDPVDTLPKEYGMGVRCISRQ